MDVITRPALRTPYCRPCVQRKVRRLFSFFNYCEWNSYVVLDEDEHQALAILAMDRGAVTLVWGSLRGISMAVSEMLRWRPFYKDNDGYHDGDGDGDEGEGEGEGEGEDEDGDGDGEGETGRCLVFESTFQRLSSSKNSPTRVDPSTFVFTCIGTTASPHSGHLGPCNRCHALVREAPWLLWRSQPHVIVEAAVCMPGKKEEPRRWQRCALTSGLIFEPPLVNWSGHAESRDDRTLWVRLSPSRHLVTPRLVRINKLVCTRLREGHEANCRLEVIQQIHGPLYADRYPLERAALVDLVRNVAATSHSAARTIQRAWRDAASNPKFRVCRRRLLLEFEEGLPCGDR
jgi:hypothetical protein